MPHASKEYFSFEIDYYKYYINIKKEDDKILLSSLTSCKAQLHDDLEYVRTKLHYEIDCKDLVQSHNIFTNIKKKLDELYESDNLISFKYINIDMQDNILFLEPHNTDLGIKCSITEILKLLINENIIYDDIISDKCGIKITY